MRFVRSNDILALGLSLAVWLGLAALPAQAQLRPPSTRLGPLALGGTVGLSAEAYGADGIVARRPGSSSALFAAATGTTQRATFGLDFHLTTEDDRLRQSMNRFALSARTRTLQAALGDISPVFSRYSVNGATVRGAHADLDAGPLSVALLAGRSRRAIETGIGAALRRPAYDRALYALRLGVGDPERTHLGLTSLVARDNPDSAPANATFLSSPAENVSFTPAFGVALLDRRLAIRGELTASAFSSDTRAARVDDGGTPALFGLFTPRVGSRFDYAGHLEARFTHSDFADTSAFDQLTLLASYERVEPGFVSLGRPYTRSDQSILRFQPQARLFDRRLQLALDLSTRRNNLDNTRNATLRRNQVNLSGQAQLSDALFLNAGYLWMANINDPLLNDLASRFLDQRLVSQTLLLSPVLTVPIEQRTHRFSLTLATQRMADRTEQVVSDRRSVDFRNVTTSLAHAVVLPRGLSVTNSVSVVTSRAPATDVRALSVTSGVQGGLLEGRLRAGAQAGISTTRLTYLSILTPDADAERETSRQYTLALNGAFRVTGRDLLRLTVRGITTRQPLRGDFQEIQSTLRFEHTF